MPKIPKKSPKQNEETVQTNAELDALQEQIASLTADLQRTRADFENYRKQIEAQKSHLAELTEQDTVKKFLPLLDDFERALTTYKELTPLQKSFTKLLSDLELEKINSDENTPFNPDFHDAISVEGDGNRELIAETLRPGYLYKSQVLRPAMVKVKNV
jgi:molecular chaperone GrpE